MSTAARKERKRENNRLRELDSNALVRRFQHPTKIGTPVTARAAFQARPIHSGGRQQASRFGLTSRMKQRLASYVGAISEPEQPAKTELALDPKPFRIGRKRYTLEEAHAIGRGDVSDVDRDDLVWSPRKGFEADRVVYGG